MKLRADADSYDPTTRAGKVFSAIFMLIGIGVLVGWFFLVNADDTFEKRCTYKVEAEFIGYEKNASADNKTYAAKYQYEFAGKSYSVTSGVYSSERLYSAGETVELYVDPNSPYVIYDPNYKIGKAISTFLLAIGIISFVLGGVFLWAGTMGKDKIEWEE